MWEAGMIFSGTSPNDRLVEIIELRDHPWFVASQFHPEFRSRPNRPHPLFRDFVRAAAVKAGELAAEGEAAQPAGATEKTAQATCGMACRHPSHAGQLARERIRRDLGHD